METERKFLVLQIPENLCDYEVKHIEQGYLCNSPAIRVRQENDLFFLTIKSSTPGISREEINFPIDENAYHKLLKKCDGIIIKKERFLIPHGNYIIELDIFKDELDGLIIAEVEFPNEKEAYDYAPPSWLGTDVSSDIRYSNAYLSTNGINTL